MKSKGTENKILTELPVMQGKGANINKEVVDCKSMVGMNIEALYNGKIYNIKILDYYIEINENNNKIYKFKTKCNDIISNPPCRKLILGQLRNVVNNNGILNNFILSDDGTYWIGKTSNTGQLFYFNGDKSEYIMKFNWCYSKGYLNNKNGESLHSIVLKNKNRNNVIDHINNDTLDNRLENLREVSIKDNTKNRNTNNKNGLTGLNKHNNKYNSCFATEYGVVCTKCKEYEDAYLDNLIAQKFLNYKHNEDKFYLIDKLSKDRIEEVECLLIKKIEKLKNKIKTKTFYTYKMELSEDKTYYTVWDSKNRKFLITNNYISLKILREYKWYCYSDKCGKVYVVNGKHRYHRMILNLLDSKYSRYVVDHLNGKGEDNRIENLVITDTYGNNCNIKGKGYTKTRYNTYQVSYMKDYPNFNELIGGNKYKIVKTEEEAKQEVKRRRKIIIDNRLQFYSKNELDEYIENLNCGQEIIIK